VGQTAERCVTKAFSLAYKQKTVERLTGANAITAHQLGRDTGIPQVTLSRWLREARSLPHVATKKRPLKTWSIEEKVRVLAAASNLTGVELAAMLEREGVHLTELEQWKASLDDGADASRAASKRIRVLEKELARKDKALAEAAALLILKKKVDQFWEDEGDDTPEESEK
jgi:hypothetical protein